MEYKINNIYETNSIYETALKEEKKKKKALSLLEEKVFTDGTSIKYWM